MTIKKEVPCYAGIGSRETPPEVLKEMTDIASRLEKKGFILRSGGAKGADSAFEAGVKDSSMKEIFYAKDCEQWCLDLVANYIPYGRPPLKRMNSYVQKLLGRNMKIVFGNKGAENVQFIICWTPLGTDDGGTGYAIRAAIDSGIPIFNLKNKGDRDSFYKIFFPKK
jgi:hypothetical protein